MSEFEIYGLILGALAVALVFYLIPSAIYKHIKLVKSFQAQKEAGEDFIPPEEPEEAGVPCRWVNIVDTVVLLAVFGLFSLTWWGQKPEEGETHIAAGIIDSEVLLANFVGQLFIIGIIVLIMMWRVKIPKQFGLSLAGNWKSLLWVPLILMVAWGVTGLVQWMGYFEYLKELYGESPLQEAVILLKESDDVVLVSLMVLVACIGAPISEEILFRGYLYPVVKGFSGKWFGVLFSGIFFGLIHYNMAGMPTLIIMGCILALSYEYTRTLWVPILAHLIFNSTTTAVQILSRYYPELSPNI